MSNDYAPDLPDLAHLDGYRMQPDGIGMHVVTLEHRLDSCGEDECRQAHRFIPVTTIWPVLATRANLELLAEAITCKAQLALIPGRDEYKTYDIVKTVEWVVSQDAGVLPKEAQDRIRHTGRILSNAILRFEAEVDAAVTRDTVD